MTLTSRVLTPLTFMQGIAGRIGREKPPPVRPIEDEMAGGLTHNSSTCLSKVLCKSGIGWKVKMGEGETNWIGGHLLADLPAPHDNELGAGQFFQPHGTPGMNT